MRRLLQFFLLLAVMIGIAVVRISWYPEPVEPEDPQLTRIKIPEGHYYAQSNFGRNLDVSPDGNQIVYVARGPSGRRLFLHTIGGNGLIELPGTEGGNDPSFSPDGSSIVFHAEGSVKRTTLDHHETTVIGKAEPPRGVSWLDEETLILGNTEGGLLRMPLNSGQPSLLSPVQSSSLARLSPQVLPGSKAILFTLADGPLSNGRIWVLNLETGQERRLLDVSAYAPRYLPTGHIVFASGPNRYLWAVRFDLEKLEVIGSPRLVVDRALWGQGSGGSTDYGVSTNGVLVYTPRPQDDLDEALAELASVDFTEIHVRLNWFEELKTIFED